MHSPKKDFVQMRRAIITGIEAFVPEYVLTNQEISSMVETSDEWITSRTGIKERRLLKGEGLGTSYMGERAVNRLLKTTGTDTSEIDTVICATVTPDMPFPATANIICDKCGILNAWGYDLNAGCSGFLFSFSTVASLIESGQSKKVILICAEKMSAITNYEDRTTSPLFGDGAVAMLIEGTEEEGIGLLDRDLHVDGVGRNFLYQKAGGSQYPACAETVANREHFVHQEGRTVFRYAVTHMTDTTQAVMKRNNLTMDDLAYFIPHQANIRIIESIREHLELPQEKLLVDIEKFGNTAGTSIPLAMWDFKDRFKKGDVIIFSAFGAGFTWGSLYYRWAY